MLKLLVGVEHERSAFKPLGFFQRLRLQRIKRLVDQHAREINVLGVEGSASNSLVETIGAKLKAKKEFDEKDRKKIAGIICDYARTEGEVADIYNAQVVKAVNSFSNFRDFEEAVAKGYFGTFEAVRHHALRKGIRVVPLERKETRKKALSKAPRGILDVANYKREEREKLRRDFMARKFGVSDLLKKLVRTSYRYDKEIMLDRTREMIDSIQENGVDCAVVGEDHALGIEKELHVLRRERVMSLFGKLALEIIGWR